jgi:hypothetical protein
MGNCFYHFTAFPNMMNLSIFITISISHQIEDGIPWVVT